MNIGDKNEQGMEINEKAAYALGKAQAQQETLEKVREIVLAEIMATDSDLTTQLPLARIMAKLQELNKGETDE